MNPDTDTSVTENKPRPEDPLVINPGQPTTGDKQIQRFGSSENLLKHVANSSPTGLWLSNESGEMIYLNNTLIDWTGLPYDTLLGTGWISAIVEGDRQRSADDFLNAIANRTHYDNTFRLKKADNSIMWCQAMGDPYYHDDGLFAGYSGFCMDIDELIRGREAIQQSESLFRTLLAQAPVALTLLWGKDLIVDIANDRALELWGRTADQVMNKPLLQAMPELLGQGFEAVFDQVLQTGEPFVANEMPVTLIRHGTSETLYISFIYEAIKNSNGQIAGILGVGIDATEQVMARKTVEESEKRYRVISTELDELVEQRTRQLQESVQDLQRSNQNLRQFAYVASHDLQEPLRKIQSFGDLLRNQYAHQLGEGGVDFLHRMQTSAGRMSTLIKDLLTYSRISTQQDTRSLVPLTAVINSALADLDLTVQDTNALVEVGDLPTVQGDQSQLTQLFQNLLSNALKFRKPTQPPHIRIRCQTLPAAELPAAVRPSREATTYYRVDVSDNGIGFDQQHVERIFQVFQRLHGKNQFAGTGIGLAICEKVAANHGGAITATSKVGNGAIFSVYLPTLSHYAIFNNSL